MIFVNKQINYHRQSIVPNVLGTLHKFFLVFFFWRRGFINKSKWETTTTTTRAKKAQSTKAEQPKQIGYKEKGRKKRGVQRGKGELGNCTNSTSLFWYVARANCTYLVKSLLLFTHVFFYIPQFFDGPLTCMKKILFIGVIVGLSWTQSKLFQMNFS